MIVVQKTITASNTDLLSGTDLAQIPSDGQLDLFIASTQNDSTLSVQGPGNEPLARAINIVQRTNGMPSLKDDVPLSLVAVQGGKYIINATVVTAATIQMTAIFRGVDEL